MSYDSNLVALSLLNFKVVSKVVSTIEEEEYVSVLLIGIWRTQNLDISFLYLMRANL